ncbi:MAG: hypothetical protein KC652_03465 [Cyanobacteria bacterium HKST-UBA01]|nr:hypothetical protein [Cyanobacteria bacterium HKST-UBA01]
MPDNLNFNAMLENISEHRWSELVKDLNTWHYIEQDAVWLRGIYVSAFAHANPKKYFRKLEQTLKIHGYSGGKLKIASINQGNDDTPKFLIFDSSHLRSVDEVEKTYACSEPKRWNTKVSERVRDWIQRLEKLQETVTTWVCNSGIEGLTVERAEPCPMQEELMVNHNVQTAEMPSFRVLRNRSQVALFRPKALWVVGANGRVDIVTQKGAPMLVDTSEPMTPKSHWKLYPTGKFSPVEFTQEEFFKLISK